MHPRRARHHRLGRDQRASARRNSLEIIRTARAVPRRARRGRSRSAPSLPGYEPLPEAERRARAAALAPVHPRAGLAPTGRRSATSPTPTSCWTSWPASKHPRAGRARHLVPGPLPAHQGPAAGRSTCRPTAPLEEVVARLRGAARRLPRRLPRPTTSGTPTAGLARRCAAPTRRSCWCPGVGHVLLRHGQADRPGGRRVLRQRDQRDARRRGGLHLRADRRGGEVPHRVLGAGGGQARSGCRSPSRWPPGSRWSPAPARASAGPSPQRLAAEGACVVVADLDAGQRRRRSPPSIGGADVAVARRRRRHRRGRRRRRRSPRRCWPSAGSTWWSTTPGCRISKPLLETTEARLGPAARRDGQGLVPGLPRGGPGHDRRRAWAATSSTSRQQELASSPGPNNVAYGAAKADQAHQVRLLAAELGEHGIRVNGDQPRRRRPRLRHLRRRLGRPAGRGLRRARRRSSARSTPSARCSSARCCPSTSPTPSSRSTAGDLSPDHRPAHPGRRRRRRRVPAVSRPTARDGRSSRRVDLGASSGRVMVGRVGAGRAGADARSHRFAQRPGRGCRTALHWDILRPVRRTSWTGCGGGRARPAARPASASTPGRSTTACSTPTGALLGNPVHYRDARTDGVVDAVHAAIRAARAVRASPGCSSCRSTRSTSSPPRAARPRSAAAAHAAADPGPARLLAHRRGRRRAYQRLHHRPARRPHRRSGRRELIAPARPAAPALLPPLRRPGRRRSGALRADVARRDRRWPAGAGDRGRLARHRLGRRRRARARRRAFAYISCGTWALVGRRARRAGAHRGQPARPTSPTRRGVDGTVRYLRNVMGLWLLQESLRDLGGAGPPADLAGAARRGGRGCRRCGRSSTPTTRRSCRPGDMPARIAAACRRTGQPVPRRPGRHSSAASSTAWRWPTGARVARRRSELSGRHVDVVHLVGGGARNALLCQLTADACGLPVRRRPGRGHRARQRAGAGPRRWARPPATWPACARCSAPPSGCAASSRPAAAPPGRPRSAGSTADG